MSKETFSKVKITIDGDDITDCWTGIKIYQSIDSPTWSCDVSILDSRNLVESLPIMHGSALNIEIATKEGIATDDSMTFSFYIYKIANKMFNNQNVETYTLKGVSKAFLLNNTIRINKKYSNKNVTNSIVDLVTDSFPNYKVSCPKPSDNTADVLLNNWTPFISIGWLLKQAHRDNRADFMFFQDDNDSFTIKSITSMYSDNENKIEDISIVYRVQNVGDDVPYTLIKHNWEHVDVQQNLHNGYYKSTTTTYDFLNKNWSESVYTHGDDNKTDLDIAKQWQDRLFDNSEKAVIAFVPKMPEIFPGQTGYDDAEKWVPSRRAILQRLDSEKFTAQLKGSVGMYKWLGKHIYIDLPSNDPNDPSQTYSRFRKGYYLISAVVHHLTPSMYLTNFEFVKLQLEK